MFNKFALLLGVLGPLSTGVPLESPSSDYSQYFDSRIIGGTDAAEGSAPHMAGMIVGHFYKSLTCGGSIISAGHVLTAAHCITSYIMGDGTLMDSLHIVVGSNSWSSGTEVQIITFHVHPQYDAWNIKHDIGILTTERIKLVKDRVAIIPLHFGFIDGGAKGMVTGWGTEQLWGIAAAKLQVLYVSTLSHQQCVDGIREVVDSWGGYAPLVDKVAEICTFHSYGHGMCHGDSGSALILLISNKKRKQIGIVSWGMPCAVGAPDVFVRVGSYKKWILKTVGLNNLVLETEDGDSDVILNSENIYNSDYNLINSDNLPDSDNLHNFENIPDCDNLHDSDILPGQSK